jgi:hypothetical protein
MKKLLLFLLLIPALVRSQTTNTNIATLPIFTGNLDSAKVVGSINGLSKNFWGVDLKRGLVKYTDTAAMFAGYVRVGRFTDSIAALRAYINSQGFLTSTTGDVRYYTKTLADTRYLQSESDPKRIVSIAVTGTGTKTITATLADNTTVTTTFTDLQGTGGGSFTFTGTSSQYVAGDGSYVAFPTIPTLTSQLTNNSGFITSTALSPYLTSATAASTYATQSALATTNSNVTANTTNIALKKNNSDSLPSTGYTSRGRAQKLMDSIYAVVIQRISDSLASTSIRFDSTQFETYGLNGIRIKSSVLGGGGSTLTQLSTPTLSATTISSTAIDVAVGSVTNASSYNLDWSANGTSGWTSLATASGTYHHTGLTASTPYYYRARAVGDGTTYSNSNYATANATTSAASSGGGGLVTTAVSTSGSFSYASPKWGSGAGYGVWSGSVASSTNGYLQAEYNNGSDAGKFVIGLDVDNTLEDYTAWKFGVYINSGQYGTVIDGTAANTGITATVGALVRIRRTGATGVVVSEYSNDGGTSWTTISTFGSTTTLTLYPKGSILAAGNYIYNVTLQ